MHYVLLVTFFLFLFWSVSEWNINIVFQKGAELECPVIIAFQAHWTLESPELEASSFISSSGVVIELFYLYVAFFWYTHPCQLLLKSNQ